MKPLSLLEFRAFAKSHNVVPVAAT
ncbi:MAG: hypothetical protein RLY29_48, partial [Actinomycetota bacterium]